ncbi:hypothetical protein [Nonomuraea jabiensis]
MPVLSMPALQEAWPSRFVAVRGGGDTPAFRRELPANVAALTLRGGS